MALHFVWFYIYLIYIGFMVWICKKPAKLREDGVAHEMSAF